MLILNRRSEFMDGRRYAVGYALASNKQATFAQPTLVNVAKERSIDLIKIDFEKPLFEQGPFDLVIHKIYGPEWAHQLTEYAAMNPAVPIIDSPIAIEKLLNRISMLQVVIDLSTSLSDRHSVSFGIPKQIVVHDAAALVGVDLEENSGLKFPVIAKPLVVDGSAKSHKMALVYCNEGLSKLEPPIVLQEFVNHGGVVFKVYVAGEHVKCVKRNSLPDVKEENLETLSFSQVSNLSSLEDGEVEIPPLGFLSDIARGLRQQLGLNLFNFDVIRDARNGDRYLVIDINYFPGYEKLPCYEQVMTDFFCDVLSSCNKHLAGGSSKLL